MNNEKNISRRNFIKNSSLGLGAGIVGASIPSALTANPSTRIANPSPERILKKIKNYPEKYV